MEWLPDDGEVWCRLSRKMVGDDEVVCLDLQDVHKEGDDEVASGWPGCPLHMMMMMSPL